MHFIGETLNKKVNFLLSPFNYTQLYNKLSTILSKEEIRILAKPDLLAGTTSWNALTAQGGKILTLDRLTEDQKDELSDRLEDIKQSIISKISKIKELEKVGAQLFTVPSSSDVRAVVEDNMVYPVLTQWGCTSNEVSSSSDPITSLLNRPRANSDLVEICFLYHTGEPAPLIPFLLNYRDFENQFHTNSEGKYMLGRCKLGSLFSVASTVSSRPERQQFQVSKNGQYIVTFSILSVLGVIVTDQNGEPVPQTRIAVNGQNEEIFTTDAEGKINLGERRVGDKITLVDTLDNSSVLEHEITREDTLLTFKVTRHKKANCRISVVDEHNNPVSGCPIHLQYNSIEQTLTTNSSGFLRVDDLFVSNKITITNPSNPSNKLEAIMENQENEIIFKLIVLPPKMVNIKLVDKRNNPLTQLNFDLMLQGKKHSFTSNEEGYCSIPFEMFSDKEWVKIHAHISSKELRKRVKKKK